MRKRTMDSSDLATCVEHRHWLSISMRVQKDVTFFPHTMTSEQRDINSAHHVPVLISFSLSPPFPSTTLQAPTPTSSILAPPSSNHVVPSEDPSAPLTMPLPFFGLEGFRCR